MPNHDTGSQVTLISDNLKTELGLETVPEPSITIRTLGDKTVPVEGRTNFKLQSLYNGESSMLKMHWLFPQFSTMPILCHMLWTLVRWNTSKGFIFRFHRVGDVLMF